MVKTRTSTYRGSPGRKRPSSTAFSGPEPKRTRSDAVEAAYNSEQIQRKELRASPAPMDSSPSTPSTRPANARNAVPANGRTRPQSTRTRSFATPSPSFVAPELSAGVNRSPNPHPVGRNSLKAHLRNVVKIVMRMNFIRKRTALFTDLESDGEFQLCDKCRSLDLLPQDFIIGTGSPANVYHKRLHHGTFIGICVKAYVCRLCRLIMKAISEHPYTKLADAVENGHAKSSILDYMDASCELSWQIDGRLPADTSNPHKTRRLCFQWTKQCYETIYVIMIGPRRTLSEARGPEYLGRLLPSQDYHNYERKVGIIRKWLDICSVYHNGCKPAYGPRFDELRQSAFFGVIDVDEMRFKPLPPDAPYVALSYQWGIRNKKDPRFTTKRKTVLAIMERNGLSKYLGQLPTTIVETITLVRDLGLKFVWIDSLCIVQDSREAWDRNATVMDLIYGNATLTVCAADGEDANAGLWALSKPEKRTAQVIESYSKDLRLMARYPCEVYVRQSKWNTRAWTYQERLLSNRCLIFTKGHMYLQCGEMTMSEDIDMETPARGSSMDDLERSHGPDGEFRDLASDPVSAYMRNVHLYTLRELTRPDDILSAFEGVGKTLCQKLGAVSVFGLPNSHFDLALLWEPADAPRRRVPGKHLPFPSWSWCGWDKRRMEYKPYAVEDCLYHLHDWLMNNTWITWYIRDGNGILRLVWDSKRSANANDSRLPDNMRGYDVRSEHNRDYYGRKIPCDMLGYQRNEFSRTIPDFPVQVRTLRPGEETPLDYPVQDRPILQFWTWSAYFKMEPGSAVPQGRIFSKRWSILDCNGDWVGTIVVDKRWTFPPDEPQQFIAISEARKFWPEEEEANGNYSRTNKRWPLYNVLLLGYDDMIPKSETEDEDEGESKSTRSSTPVDDDDHSDLIAYRRGLGKIYQEAFDQACLTPHQGHRKEWREIVLG